jgi:hypothetical protein
MANMKIRLKTFIVFTVLIAAVLHFTQRSGVTVQAQQPGETLFAEKILPVFVAKCQSCHNADYAQSGLDLSSRAALLKGGQRGAGIVPGDAANSLLIVAITGADEKRVKRMPPSGQPLDAATIAAFKQWIEAGVPWPERKVERGKTYAGVTREAQRRNLDLLAALNQSHQRQHPDQADLAPRIEAYELAFRMQMEVPGIVNIDKEPAATKALYGIGEKDSDAFGRRCLLARRLDEQGVRFVQVYSSGWDSHYDIVTAHGNRMRAIDKPIAGLLKDLKRTGLLNETLVVWAGEFGRSPDNGQRGGKAYGRDRNTRAMSMWFAGGEVKPGIVGATDEIGDKALEVVHPLRDVHVTLLRLLGLDDDRLRYFHNGRQMQLSQFGGQVITSILNA